MKKLQLNFFLLITCAFISTAKINAQTLPTENINWSNFISSKDLIFNTISSDFYSGVFTGNGSLGTMTFRGDALNVLRINIGRTDVYDHRSGDPLFYACRLPLGYFTLTTVGTTVTANTSRINLWQANNTGKITTEAGSVEWKITAVENPSVIILDVKTTGTESGATFAFVPAVSRSPRMNFDYTAKPAGYQANPSATPNLVKDGVTYCSQTMLAGGGYATAYKKEELTSTSYRYYISVGYSTTTEQTAIDEAVNAVNNGYNGDYASFINTHENWWQNYYQKSYISVPHVKLEQFYWLQMYKLGSALRQGGPALDLMGPWFNDTPWPAYWLNLNIQLAYSPLFKSNHLELSSTLLDLIDKNLNSLRQNVPSGFQSNSYAVGRATSPNLLAPISVTKTSGTSIADDAAELGNLAWMLHSYWMQYKFGMDATVLQKFIPILTKATNYYLHLVEKQEQYYNLPYTYSPEYAKTRNNNYDLALLRWSLQTLLKEATATDPTLRATWQDVHDNLIPYPADGNILKIGSDRALNSSHRHYSHLMMIYPLQIMTWEDSSKRDMITASIANWQNLTGQLQGYSFTGSSSMYSMMGLGDKSLTQLNTFLNSYSQPNTFYKETGPVIETPLAVATSVQEMLLQSRNDKVFVFNAIPTQWTKISFKDLLVEGAFKVSGVYQDGETKWVNVKSSVGGVCNVNIKGLSGKIKAIGDITTADLNFETDTTVSFNLAANKQVWLYANEQDLSIALEPASSPDSSIDAVTDKVTLPKSSPDAVVYSTADTYIYDAAANKNSNYGTETEMLTKTGGSGYNRQLFMKFDLSTLQLNSDVNKVYLKLGSYRASDIFNTSGNSAKAALLASFKTASFICDYLPNNNWTETNMTWNRFTTANMVDITTYQTDSRKGSSIDFNESNFLVINGSALLLDITAVAKARMKSVDKTLSLRVYSSSDKAVMQFYTKEASVVNDFKPQLMVYIKDADNTLPVQLVNFSAKEINGNILLQWRTTAEINNRQFEVQRSYNGVDFETITLIKGKENSNELNNYSYVDHKVKIGLIYYRLKQIDFNGDFKYSEVKVLDVKALAKAQITLYPNPANSKIEVKVNSTGKYKIIDIIGIVRQTINLTKSLSTTVDVSTLENGVYFLQSSSEDAKAIKFIIKR